MLRIKSVPYTIIHKKKKKMAPTEFCKACSYSQLSVLLCTAVFETHIVLCNIFEPALISFFSYQIIFCLLKTFQNVYLPPPLHGMVCTVPLKN